MIRKALLIILSTIFITAGLFSMEHLPTGAGSSPGCWTAITSFMQDLFEYDQLGDEQFNWQDLPTEIKAVIISFIPTVTYQKQSILDSLWQRKQSNTSGKGILSLFLVNNEFKQITELPEVLACFLKRVIDEKPEAAISAFMRAVKGDNAKIVKAFLKADIAIDALDSAGETALMIAATSGHRYLVKLLIEQWADTEVRDREGNTALMRAAASGYDRIVHVLAKLGAEVNVTNNTLKTALHCAAEHGQLDVVYVLLDYNAEVKKIDAHRNSPVMLAKKNGHKQIVKLLIESGDKFFLTAEELQFEELLRRCRAPIIPVTQVMLAKLKNIK